MRAFEEEIGKHLHTLTSSGTHNPEEGEDTTAVCEWTGSPIPEVTWFKNGEPLNEETLPFCIRITKTNFHSDLEIQVVELDDVVDYICNVSNPVGFDISVATLEVRGTWSERETSRHIDKQWGWFTGVLPHLMILKYMTTA